MSRRKEISRALHRRPASGSYEVGHGKPPERTQFRPGRSGNPRGRPKGSKNRLPGLHEERLKSIILQEAYRTVKVTDKGRPVTLSMAEAIVRSLALAAAKGHQRSQRLFTDLLGTIEQANIETYGQYLKTMIEYKIDWEEELERRRRLGIVAQDPIPHPDHINIDMGTGLVRMTGPFTKEEKVVWDDLRKKKASWHDEAASLKALLAAETDEGVRHIMLDELAHANRMLSIIGRCIKD